jgi:acylphosphatase
MSSDPSRLARLVATVRGRVQGVGFRYYVEGEAERLGLTGYVRNDSDGGVEVVAEGDRKVLEGFLALLRKGPSGSAVTDVNFTFIPATGEFYDFTIKRWQSW